VGFSLGEILLLVVVGIIVVGPKNLPPMMRTAGQWVARLRRMSMDLRSQSGIDDIIRQEGLSEHLHELRSLSSLSRLNMVDSLIAPAAAGAGQASARAGRTPAGSSPSPSPKPSAWTPREPLREREYPIAGCDSYGVLPDDATPYLPPVAPDKAVSTDPEAAPAALPAPTEAPADQASLKAQS